MTRPENLENILPSQSEGSLSLFIELSISKPMPGAATRKSSASVSKAISRVIIDAFGFRQRRPILVYSNAPPNVRCSPIADISPRWQNVPKLPLLFLAASQASQPNAVVYGWDDRPTLTVAEGSASKLAPLKSAAERCGFSRTWVWDDDTDEAQFWVLAQEASRKRTGCLNRWRAKHQRVEAQWKLRRAAKR